MKMEKIGQVIRMKDLGQLIKIIHFGSVYQNKHLAYYSVPL